MRSTASRGWTRTSTTIKDDEQFVIGLLRAKKILVTHGTGFNWFEPDHFRLVTLPDLDTLTEAIGRIADFLATHRPRPARRRLVVGACPVASPG